MEVGGLVAQTFKIFLGNPDILALNITFIVVISLLLTIVDVADKTKQ